MLNNVLNLGESKDGNRIKQGDQSIMRYVLADSNDDNLQLNGKKAVIYLYNNNGVAYREETTVNENVVDVVIKSVLPADHYTLEIIVDDKYIFPSDNKTKIEVTNSVLGKGTTEIVEQNLYGDLIEYGINNHLFDNFKGDAGEPGKNGSDGKPFTYEDLTEEQKQDLASYVPVKDIPDSHIIDVIKQDYADGIGELDVLFVNFKNQDIFYPVVFSKKSYDPNSNVSYEEWKNNTIKIINNYAIQADVQSSKELYEKALEDRNDFFGFSLPPFPIYYTIEMPDYNVDDTKYLSNNYLMSTGLIGVGDKGTLTARLEYNGQPIEQNKVVVEFE